MLKQHRKFRNSLVVVSEGMRSQTWLCEKTLEYTLTGRNLKHPHGLEKYYKKWRGHSTLHSNNIVQHIHS
jgi:hypothetical protein